jgi:mRNA interferase MazF
MGQVLKKKDIVLVPVSFSDMSGCKKRPALIISNDRFNKASPDVLACSITSNMKGLGNLIRIKPEDWKEGLYSESGVKADSIQTIAKSIVIKKIGRLGTDRFNEVREKILELIG